MYGIDNVPLIISLAVICMIECSPTKTCSAIYLFTNLTIFTLTLYWIAGKEIGCWNTFTTFVDYVHIHGADRQKERGNA